jgi:hypothetical protein
MGIDTYTYSTVTYPIINEYKGTIIPTLPAK